MSNRTKLGQRASAIVSAFENRSGISDIEYDIKQRSDGQALVFKLANPTERFFKILSEITETNDLNAEPLPTIEKRSPPSRLKAPETRYLLRTLSESLNINRYSFKDEFFRRYTKSVSNAEDQITSAANHIVYGRRGAGKSSLLLYAMRTRELDGRESIWIDMQTFEKRSDIKVCLEVISAILDQLKDTKASLFSAKQIVRSIVSSSDIKEEKIREIIPAIREAIKPVKGDLFVMLDDFHLVDETLQPKILSILYSFCRGNQIFLKISAIETLTKTWNSKDRTGLQVPHDAQLIKLDYNLTMPHRAEAHIEGILGAHAIYCGLPSVRFLCVSKDVLSRLVWVSAGVPRDALNMFAQALTRAITANRGRVSVTDINLAASEMVSEKIRDIDTDVTGAYEETGLQSTLEFVKEFCIKTKRKNAFLVEIKRELDIYRHILELVDLRLIHVINEGITVGDAGRKYIALILDYGFYTGIRSAQSVDLFNKQTKQVSYKELRKLPILNMQQ